MSHERNLDYLNKRRIVYRRAPINDKPSEVYQWGGYYADGTYECYELFRSKAKITTYKSLKWHMLVLWYLNPQLDQDALFYLRARGIPKKEAKALLTFAFANNVLESVNILSVKSRIKKIIANKLEVDLGFDL